MNKVTAKTIGLLSAKYSELELAKESKKSLDRIPPQDLKVTVSTPAPSPFPVKVSISWSCLQEHSRRYIKELEATIVELGGSLE